MRPAAHSSVDNPWVSWLPLHWPAPLPRAQMPASSPTEGLRMESRRVSGSGRTCRRQCRAAAAQAAKCSRAALRRHAASNAFVSALRVMRCSSGVHALP